MGLQMHLPAVSPGRARQASRRIGGCADLRREERDLAEADLLLSRKYGEPRRFDDVIAWYLEFGSEAQRLAAAEFVQRREEGRLPSPMPGAERVAFFRDGAYAVHRFGVSLSS